MIYLDTSVLVPCYCPEALSVKAQKAVSAAKGLSISPLVEVEFHSAVAMKVRSGVLEVQGARQALRIFADHRADGIYQMVSVEAAQYTLAQNWLSKFTTPLRTLDALHLAITASHEASLLTADEDLAQSAEQLGVKVELVR
ncbi:MAG: type II toxin-antitoxin system VapC family toxin [Phycisphaeraceae bacterium]|nr:type II toxin-antitoxin system VapC family toxin [Phycisphaeraceae bacterium]